MANSLTGNGLTIGTLNNTITEFLDPSNSKMVIGDNANVSVTFDATDQGSVTDSNSTTITLPSLSIGQSRSNKRVIGRSILGGGSGGTITVKLPASGTYAYAVKNFSVSRLNGHSAFTLSMNVLTATRGSGGTTVGSATSTHQNNWAGIAVLYYRLK